MARGGNSFKLISSLFRKRSTLAFELTELYRPTINRHKEKLIELLKEKADIASQSNIARKLRVIKGFYTVEAAPPSSMQEMTQLKAEIKMISDFMKTGCYKFLTVKQAWLLFLVCIEVFMWFFLGETIGKFHIVGYKV